MIKVTILYPAGPSVWFDHDYYETVHMPLSIGLIGDAMRSVTVERGISLGAPWPEPTFRAICSFVCDSLETYQSAFMPHMERLQRDMPNYTDIEAIIQISNIVIDHPAGRYQHLQSIDETSERIDSSHERSDPEPFCLD